MNTLNNKEKLLLAIEVQEKVIAHSISFDKNEKQAIRKGAAFTKGCLINDSKINSYQLKSLLNPFLTLWNESIGPDTEFFWEELRKNGVDYERKEPLKFVLENGRFRNVHQGMEARQNWSEVRKLSTIKERFTKTEIEKIDELVSNDEKKRLDLLKKCLKKKEIPQSQYLRFGDSMAYFNNCDLFRNYFTPIEVEELYSIWKNFKSK